VRLTDGAIDDARQAFDFYENERKGLGSRFIRAVGVAIQDILDMPDAWTRMRGGFRRRQAPDFPYAVIYRRADDHITVVAVWHQKRGHANWRGRL
jgi:toxin ParE1/3/4